MPKTLNIAVIGAGTMAQAVHLPVLRRRWDRFTIAALVDHSPRRRREAAEVWGLEEDKRYESVADLIAAVRAKTLALDGAVLSTDGLHVEDLLALMRRGIPVLVEPPLGYSAEEVAKVADFERMTGRRLVMMAYPQQYDDSVTRMGEHIAVKDLRMVDHEVLMPASQPLYGGAHVTTSSYDLPTEVRSQRRKSLQAAVEAGTGGGATQRDRDLYVKGLLTGVAHQMSVIEASYGPIVRLSAVRHWPKGVIPGSLELLGELEGGAQVRLVWHYLPFAPEYSESLQVLSARRRMRVELPAPSHGDSRSTISLREKKSGIVQETSTMAPKGATELMWEAFHAFVEKGRQPVSGAAEARDQATLLREVLSSIVIADGRSLEAEESEEGADSASGDEAAADGATVDAATDGAPIEADETDAVDDRAPVAAAPAVGAMSVEVATEGAQADDSTSEGTAADESAADGTAAEGTTAVGTADDGPATAVLAADGPAAVGSSEPAAETLEQPVQDAATEVPAREPAPETLEPPMPAAAAGHAAPEAAAGHAAPEPAADTLEQPAQDAPTGERAPGPVAAGGAAEEITDVWGLEPRTTDAPATDVTETEAPATDEPAGEDPRR